MSYREVSALRKAGQLEEATVMAREDIARYRDEWSCRALFWCLHEAAKNAESESLELLAEEMQNLLEDMGEDSVAIECIQRIERRLIPHAETVRQAGEEAKISSPADAYNKILNIFNAGELDESLHNDFAWIIWRALHADQSEDVEYRKSLLEVYKQLNIERPSMLHSLMLNEAVRVEKAWPQMFMFTEFIAWWGLRNLTDDDWNQFVTDDGKRLMSRVEKMIYLYTKEVLSIQVLVPSSEFTTVLDTAISKWNKDDNILRCKAMLLSKQGAIQAAVDLYKRAISLTSGQKYYLWNDLANLTTDNDLKIGLLSKALMLHMSEEFLGKLRAQLALSLCNKGLYANAMYEIEIVNTTYQANGWNLSPQIRGIMQMIPSGITSEDNTARYAEWALIADEYLYADISSEYMVKVAHREDIVERDGRQRRVIKWTLVDNAGNIEGIKPRKFNLDRARIGDCFEVKRSDGRIVLVSPIGAQNVAWRKSVRGVVSIKTNKEGKNFGFVEGCYVPPKLIRGISHGTTVECVAICQGNKWKCISVRQVE